MASEQGDELTNRLSGCVKCYGGILGSLYIPSGDCFSSKPARFSGGLKK